MFVVTIRYDIITVQQTYLFLDYLHYIHTSFVISYLLT